ncbi:hypothetical protein CsSME_00036384 [Camellia sinensis var. sinensis]
MQAATIGASHINIWPQQIPTSFVSTPNQTFVPILTMPHNNLITNDALSNQGLSNSVNGNLDDFQFSSPSQQM